MKNEMFLPPEEPLPGKDQSITFIAFQVSLDINNKWGGKYILFFVKISGGISKKKNHFLSELVEFHCKTWK